MRALITLLPLLLIPSVVQAQAFDRLTRPMATLTDPATMTALLEDLLILSPDTLSSIHMVDITANGYGPDDVLILNPTNQVHFLGEFIPPTLRALVGDWSFESDYQYEALHSETSATLLAAHTSEDPAAAIAGSCLSAVASHYEGDELSMLLNQRQGTVRLELWGFNPDGLRYGGAGEAISCEINRQKFEFARPITVTAFRDGDTCVEAWGDQGSVQTRPCSN